MASPFAAGVREPATTSEVEALLRHVPEFAFLPAFEALVPYAREGAEFKALLGTLDAPWQAQLCVVLDDVLAQARLQQAGGTAFVARTMLHFLRTEPVALAEHPLIVSLCLRGQARAGAFADTPQQVGQALDEL